MKLINQLIIYIWKEMIVVIKLSCNDKRMNFGEREKDEKGMKSIH